MIVKLSLELFLLLNDSIIIVQYILTLNDKVAS